jgi:uncharacterized protein with NRDE domain
MCLVALAFDQNARFPLVLAANRDEFHARPAARLAWWSPDDGLPDILSGRDLQGGGTWLGLNADGRLALVTNVRRPDKQDPEAPSRGEIVPLWLRGDLPPDRFWPRVALSGYNPFNLIAADFRRGDCWWASNEQASPQRIERGLHGLSNAQLDTPWPKLTRLKARLRDSLAIATSVDDLAALLFDALADRTIPPDAELPHTGIALERERLLSPAFIETPDGRYGTRCSTLVITERLHKRSVTHVLERSFSPGSRVAVLRRVELKDWPPRYEPEGHPQPRAEQVPVADAEDLPPPRKGRARGVLKPAVPGRRPRSTPLSS